MSARLSCDVTCLRLVISRSPADPSLSHGEMPVGKAAVDLLRLPTFNCKRSEDTTETNNKAASCRDLWRRQYRQPNTTNVKHVVDVWCALISFNSKILEDHKESKY